MVGFQVCERGGDFVQEEGSDGTGVVGLISGWLACLG